MPRFASPSVTCPAVASSTALMRSHSPSATAPGSAPAAAALSVVRSASHRRARACRSAMLPCQTMRPLLMMPTWSAIWSISESRWLETMTVQPKRPGISRTSWRISWMPEGSRPLVGSSRSSSLGRPMSAAAIPRRCLMPSEKCPTSFPWVFASSRRTTERASSMQLSGSPRRRRTISRFSRAVRCG